MKRLRIESAGPTGRNSRVWLDGEEISSTVTRIELTLDCRDMTRAVITTVHQGVTVDVVLPEREEEPAS